MVFARINHIGWIHLWRSEEAFLAGEPSEHFFNPRIDPRWADYALPQELRLRLERGDLVPIPDPGYLDEEG